LIILSLFLSFTENKNAKRALEERVSIVRRRVQQQRPKAFGKKKGPLSLSRSREKRFGVWVCVPRVTNFERTVSCREKNEKMEQKQPHCSRAFKRTRRRSGGGQE